MASTVPSAPPGGPDLPVDGTAAVPAASIMHRLVPSHDWFNTDILHWRSDRRVWCRYDTKANRNAAIQNPSVPIKTMRAWNRDDAIKVFDAKDFQDCFSLLSTQGHQSKELLPDWRTFCLGILDSPIPPGLSVLEEKEPIVLKTYRDLFHVIGDADDTRSRIDIGNNEYIPGYPDSVWLTFSYDDTTKSIDYSYSR